MPLAQSGRGAARLARLHGVQEVAGSNPVAPTAVPFNGHKVQTVLPGGRFYFFLLDEELRPRVKSHVCHQMNKPFHYRPPIDIPLSA
jgi:hypothetical protein